ncbi:hypothetical protein LCGC14_2007410 [marine sediment metagenome]|uniref:Ketoreductase domain-containing protein n=1 Tax=marine sediment metagenome TaxID=412755 RepID=A0A0F9F1G4_9ZZZZ
MSAAHAETAALVTGGAQGLGLAVARQLIAEGCRSIALADINQAAVTKAAQDLSDADTRVVPLVVDMADAEAVLAMVDAAAARMGRVTALVNAAARTDRGSIFDTSPAQWDGMMDTNAKGPFFALQRFAALAAAAGHPASAVNILSIVVHGGLPVLAPYVASKGALMAITRNSAAALARHRIRVNGINVGWMDTPAEDVIQRKWHGRTDGWQAEAGAHLPFGRLLHPEEVARQVTFLLGPHSGVVTGSVMDFDQQVIGAYPDTDTAG